MHEEHRTAGEVDELMLPAALNVENSLARNLRGHARRERAPLRRVVRAQLLDGAAAHDAPQTANSELDFRQLWHSAIVLG